MTVMWGMIAASALLWPDHLRGRFDGVPLDSSRPIPADAARPHVHRVARPLQNRDEPLAAAGRMVSAVAADAPLRERCIGRSACVGPQSRLARGPTGVLGDRD